jgi:hypothetical protein
MKNQNCLGIFAQSFIYIGNNSRVLKGCGPDKPGLVFPDLSLVGQRVVDSFIGRLYLSLFLE